MIRTVRDGSVVLVRAWLRFQRQRHTAARCEFAQNWRLGVFARDCIPNGRRRETDFP
ncbi:MAG TPA: hypothetical protein VG225_17755 [Terracidiphilus sp.]|nr:hypothetical protein [Terracidiphilus sp.]